MKSGKLITQYVNRILSKTNRPDGLELDKVQSGCETESFRHALQDCIASGMVIYTQLNPVAKIKRIAWKA